MLLVRHVGGFGPGSRTKSSQRQALVECDNDETSDEPRDNATEVNGQKGWSGWRVVDEKLGKGKTGQATYRCDRRDEDGRWESGKLVADNEG